MFETKPVLNKAWAELSPAQRNERWRQNEDEELRQEEEGGRGGRRVGKFQVRRGNNPHQSREV